MSLEEAEENVFEFKAIAITAFIHEQFHAEIKTDLDLECMGVFDN